MCYIIFHQYNSYLFTSLSINLSIILSINIINLSIILSINIISKYTICEKKTQRKTLMSTNIYGKYDEQNCLNAQINPYLSINQLIYQSITISINQLTYLRLSIYVICKTNPGTKVSPVGARTPLIAFDLNSEHLPDVSVPQYQVLV